MGSSGVASVPGNSGNKKPNGSLFPIVYKTRQCYRRHSAEKGNGYRENVSLVTDFGVAARAGVLLLPVSGALPIQAMPLVAVDQETTGWEYARIQGESGRAYPS